jgi:prepilin-type processing-associated H-X9-DG protein
VGNFAVSNYRATCGTFGTNGEALMSFPNDEGDMGGVMYQNSRTRIADVTDGTSNTLMVGEGKYGVPRHLSDGNTLSSALWCGMSGAYNVSGIGDYIWIDNVMWPTGGNPAWAPDVIDEAWNSNHPALVHFLFVDGSVRGLSPQMEDNLRTQLGVRNDGLPLGGEP